MGVGPGLQERHTIVHQDLAIILARFVLDFGVHAIGRELLLDQFLRLPHGPIAAALPIRPVPADRQHIALGALEAVGELPVVDLLEHTVAG